MIRLDKLICLQKSITRTEAKSLIRAGVVCIDGKITKNANFKLDPQFSEILVSGRELNYKKCTYIIMNKPIGVVSATGKSYEKNVIDLIPDDLLVRDLFPVGRLDKDTSGLLIITNDGVFSHKITSPKSGISKVYRAKISEPIRNSELDKLRQGIILSDGTICLPAKVTVEECNTEILISICEGKYHQVKRMIAAAGSSVISLKRIKIGDLCIDEFLEEGECRELTEKEKNMIFGTIVQ